METANTNSQSPPSTFKLHPIGIFAAVLVVLATIETLVELVALPVQIAAWASLAFSVITLGAPIAALYFASQTKWSVKLAIVAIAIGLGCQIIFTFLGYWIHPHASWQLFTIAWILNMSQVGLLTWCMGLGSLIASVIKDKNMILPVAIFLAGFDAFLVFTAIGFTRQMLEKSPKVFQHISYKVPKIAVHSHLGPIVPAAQIGPADFIFIAMFFTVLWKYKMRTVKTLYWLVPTLLGYLFVVLLFSNIQIGPISLGALPALLPIGTVVILVNWKEWTLSKEEKISTIAVGVIALLLVGFGFLKSGRGQQVGPSRPVPALKSPPPMQKHAPMP